MDDWKILTQGGYAAHDVKYRNARAFINRCPMLITSQRKLDFGPADQPAMERRLRTYTFQSLPKPKKGASAWMKKHAMDCVVWAAKMAKAPDGEEESEDEDQSSADEEYMTASEGILMENEKGEIRGLSLPALLTQEALAERVRHRVTMNPLTTQKATRTPIEQGSCKHFSSSRILELCVEGNLRRYLEWRRQEETKKNGFGKSNMQAGKMYSDAGVSQART